MCTGLLYVFMYYKQRGVNMCMAGAKEVRQRMGGGVVMWRCCAPPSAFSRCPPPPPLLTWVHAPITLHIQRFAVLLLAVYSCPYPSHHHTAQSMASIFFKFVSFIYAPYLLVMVPLLTSRSEPVDGVCGYVLNPTFNKRGRIVFLGEWQGSQAKILTLRSHLLSPPNG